jgi:hypothetical protein
MKRSILLFSMALLMTCAAVAVSASSPFPKPKLGGCNSVCRSNADCTDTRCPFCEPFLRGEGDDFASALCKSF